MKVHSGRLYLTHAEEDAWGEALTPKDILSALPDETTGQLNRDPVGVVVVNTSATDDENIHPQGWGECPVCGKAGAFSVVTLLTGREEATEWDFSGSGWAWSHLHDEGYAVLRWGRWIHVDVATAADWSPVDADPPSREWLIGRVRLMLLFAWIVSHPFRMARVFRIDVWPRR